MRICVVAEGCYPFVMGGVSSWLHELIQRMPEHEFVIWAIGPQEKNRGKFAYTMPPNVVSVVDVYLDTVLNMPMRKKHRIRLNAAERQTIKQMIECEDPDWDILFNLFHTRRLNPVAFLLDHVFLDILKEVCADKHPSVPFAEYFWTARSMFLPLLFLLGGDAPQADLYHSVSTGYAGVLAAMAAQLNRKPYVLTEHGIYTREREEEILRSTWVQPQFKDMWINMFYMFSRCAYQAADRVTSLFTKASDIQREIGAPADKLMVIPNGVHFERYSAIPEKEYNGHIDIGAIVRVVPIKDIKTMLYAFSQASDIVPNLSLHIIGPCDEDEAYFGECLAIKEELGLERVHFTGRVNVTEYMAKLDFTLLTSISEGMPLVILESNAARRPSVATDVGSCRELIEGEPLDIGPGGICVPAMHQRAIADAIVKLSTDTKLRHEMGQNGQERVRRRYLHEDMMNRYREAYKEAAEHCDKRWKEER